MSINFISSKDSDETGNMHTKSNNREIMTGNQTDEIIEKHFWSLQKISLERGGSYIDFPTWLRNTKATLYPKK